MCIQAFWTEIATDRLNTVLDDLLEELKIEKLNSCAETGEIAGAIPDMDIVALAPWGRGAHTPREHLDLDTLQPFWEFLTALLRAMCEEA